LSSPPHKWQFQYLTWDQSSFMFHTESSLPIYVFRRVRRTAKSDY
jgi:hypothetical protein